VIIIKYRISFCKINKHNHKHEIENMAAHASGNGSIKLPALKRVPRPKNVNLNYVNQSTGFDAEKVALLPERAKRQAWLRCAAILDWESGRKDDLQVRAEIEHIFGHAPYQFLLEGDTVHVRWLTGKRQRQNNVLSSVYRARRSAPNYRNFSGTIYDTQGRRYKMERNRRDLANELKSGGKDKVENVEIKFSVKLPRRSRSERILAPDVGEEVRIFHGNICRGHSMLVERTLVLPTAATGTVWMSANVKENDLLSIIDGCEALPVVDIEDEYRDLLGESEDRVEDYGQPLQYYDHGRSISDVVMLQRRFDEAAYR
jgi:hypothetical protein